MPTFDKTTVTGGLTVIRVPRQGTEAITVTFFFKAGSRYEQPAINGLAHFTEHMVFKGGQAYPTFQHVNDAINQVGGYFNAYTSEEITAFYVKIAADRVEIALDVLSDILTRPQYDQAELDKERGVIIEEINMYEDDPPAQLNTLMDQTMYPDHPVGRPVLGTKRTIRDMPRQAFIDYTKGHFTPDRAALVLAGNLKKATKKIIGRFVGRFKGRSDVKTAAVPQAQDQPRLGLKKRQTEQTHLGVALRGPALRERDQSFTLEILSMILGGNTSSRLFAEVREKQGLAYAINSSPEQLTDAGSLDIYAGVSHNKAGHALSAIIKELQRLRDGDLSAGELRIAKESIKGTRALRWEDSVALGTLFGIQHLLLDDILTPPEILKRFAAVTKRDVTGLARQMVADDRLNVAVVGPHEKSTFAPLLSLQ